ncbi:hypothetical protein SDC9_124964 [bioreactor metagenome]|uniref:Uncharacterized protein n=1 Tax=bioreactor metagenome TaxID=1076179 RepID=A0A645CM41_9ZZZZ
MTTVDGAQAPPDRIAKRMAASVNTVGEHVLIGRKAAEVAASQGSYERIVKEVFDRILVGYTVETVTIKPGVETDVVLELAPWGEVVREVDLEVDYGSNSPELVTLIKSDMGDVEDRVNNVLIGLPVDAVDWAGGVSKTIIQEIMAEQLPEFRTNFEVESGVRTVVKLSLVPAGATIQDVHVSLVSHTIPNVMLSGIETVFDDSAKSLAGLPVAFVERHRDYFTEKFRVAASRHHMARNYGLTLVPSITPGTDTLVNVRAETTKYNIWLEGYLDVGRNEHDNTSARLHAGKYISSRDEAYVEVNFFPSSVSWKFMPGWTHRIGSDTFVGVKYNSSDNEAVLTLNQTIAPNWSLRAERRTIAGINEVGLRYRMHDHLSAEYIFTDEESWLRLVGHL